METKPVLWVYRNPQKQSPNIRLLKSGLNSPDRENYILLSGGTMPKSKIIIKTPAESINTGINNMLNNNKNTKQEKYDKKIKYLVNDILLNIENLESIFVPINKHGSQAKDSVKAMNDAYESDNQIITFPAGLCSRKQNGQIKDLQWAKSFVVKAKAYKRDIIPVHFEGRNSSFFYNLSNLRMKLGIKLNIEMLYLADEMMKKKNAEFTITFGKPISWESLNNSNNPLQWAQKIKESVYTLNQI